MIVVKLGVIGGSGVYGIKGARVTASHAVTTAFGDPSDKVFELQAEKSFLFLPRHGIGHRLLPSRRLRDSRSIV